jgi:hypothetical protein
MQHIDPNLVSYEHAGALQYVGIDEVREVCRRGLESWPGPIEFEILDLTVCADGDLAVAWGVDRTKPSLPSRASRPTMTGARVRGRGRIAVRWPWWRAPAIPSRSHAIESTRARG